MQLALGRLWYFSIHAVSWDGEAPYETQEVLSIWLGITKEGVVALKDEDYNYKKYRVGIKINSSSTE